MIFEHDQVTKIHHRSGETADIPDWVLITKGFQLQNPFNDQKAAVARDGITPLLLSSFFEKTAACHANAFDTEGSKMKALFDAAVAKTEAAKNTKMTEITTGIRSMGWPPQATSPNHESRAREGRKAAKAYCQVHGNVVRNGHAPL